MEKGISYLNRTFYDYRNSLLNYTKEYYPELETQFNDASVGSWMLDIVSNIGDNLSYHIDRVYQETNIDSAKEKSSVFNIARNNGIKIPGPKASMCEVEFSCVLPISKTNDNGEPDWSLAPVIKKGTRVSAGNQVFELMYDVNFKEQYNENGISNRKYINQKNSNGFNISYIVTKTGIVSAGETKIYTKTIKESDITPFMSFVIPDINVMNVESIIFKDENNYYGTPTMDEFFYDREEKKDVLERFFEVDSLSQQYRWGDYNNTDNIVVYNNDSLDDEKTYIKKGAWIPLRKKFITEFTDNGYLKITFGSGYSYVSNSGETYENLISHLINNDGLGVLPKAGKTMYVLYRKGGGAQSNVAQGSIKTISYLKTDDIIDSDVKRSIKVTNNIPSILGRDMPSIDEIKYLIKYNNGAQERCVTIKDYHDRISKLPSRYGCPFRYSVSEENNKIMLYLIGLDSNGKLTNVLPNVLVENIQNYISEYRMINDYIEIKSGRIINLQFEIDLFVDKNYNTSDVLSNVINTVKKYMAIDKLQMGDDIFVGDIEKEISKIDGVLNLIELRVYNIYDNNLNYSQTRTTQKTKTLEECYANDSELDVYSMEENRSLIDLSASDKMLYTENDTMFEIKFPEKDIICRVKTR